MSQQHATIINAAATQLLARSTLPINRLRFELNHAFNVVEWVLRLSPTATPELQLAALLHDCDRFFPDRRVTKESYHLPEQYDQYKRAHSKNSATIAGEIIRATDFSGSLEVITDAIMKHEFGGTPDADVLKDCDSLSFFDQNLIDYFEQNAATTTKHKITFMYQRMSAEAKEIWTDALFSYRHIAAIQKLVGEALNEQSS